MARQQALRHRLQPLRVDGGRSAQFAAPGNQRRFGQRRCVLDKLRQVALQRFVVPACFDQLHTSHAGGLRAEAQNETEGSWKRAGLFVLPFSLCISSLVSSLNLSSSASILFRSKQRRHRRLLVQRVHVAQRIFARGWRSVERVAAYLQEQLVVKAR